MLQKVVPTSSRAGISQRSSKKLQAGKKPARAVLERRKPLGWDTTDEDEIELRRWRGRTEITAITALEAGQSIFGTFQTRSATGGAYEVEIRDLKRRINSCGCIDHQVNGLGTCKHIEGVLAALDRRRIKGLRTAATTGSGRIEIFVSRAEPVEPTILWPHVKGRNFAGARMAAPISEIG
jgi:hypothetical protein